MVLNLQQLTDYFKLSSQINIITIMGSLISVIALLFNFI